MENIEKVALKRFPEHWIEDSHSAGYKEYDCNKDEREAFIEGWLAREKHQSPIQQPFEKVTAYTDTTPTKASNSTIQQQPEVSAEEIKTAASIIAKKLRYTESEAIKKRPLTIEAMNEFASLRVSSETEVLREMVNNMLEVFKWLLGHYDFPEPPAEGRPRYYWRSHLQDKLKDIGIDLNGTQSPFQPRETDIDNALKEKQ